MLSRVKTRVPALSRGAVCVILSLAVLIQNWRVRDTHTHGQTHDDSIYYASIELCGKKSTSLLEIAVLYVSNCDAPFSKRSCSRDSAVGRIVGGSSLAVHTPPC